MESEDENIGRGRADETQLELVARAVSGESEARARLVQCERDQVFLWSLRLLRDRELAHDACQEVLVSMWRHVGELQDPVAFPAWLYRITLNACLRIVQDSGQEGPGGKLPDLCNGAPADAEARIADRVSIDQAMTALNEHERLALDLHFRYGLSGRELGRKLGISPGAARFRVFSALKRLRAAFNGKERR